MAILGGQGLAATRFPNVPLPHAARVAFLCAAVLYLLLILLGYREPPTGRPAPWEGRGKWSFLLFVVGFGLSWPLRTHFWAVPLLSLSIAEAIGWSPSPGIAPVYWPLPAGFGLGFIR